MYTVERETVGDFTVEVFADYDFDLDFVIGDCPLLVFSKQRYATFHEIMDNSKQVAQAFEVLASVEDSDWKEAIWIVDGLAEIDELKDGRIRIDSDYFNSPRYYKTLESAAKRTIEECIGLDLKDVKVERISTQDAEVYIAWSKKELDKWAGIKDANPPLQSIRHYLDGDVYGFCVKDKDGEVLDSCGGFIGDFEDCMAEGIESAKSVSV